MMETEEKYKVVIVDDERTAIDALRRELEPYREFEVKGIAAVSYTHLTLPTICSV